MSFSVLVVEDEKDWLDALCEMYGDLLAQENPKIFPAPTVPAARQMLRTNEFDLLSLDINMSEGDREEGDGRTLVREASELEAVGGLVVITGLAYDDELDVIMPEEDIPKVRATLGLFLRKYFDRKNIQHLQKPPNTSVEESVQIFREELTRIDLLNLCDARNVFHFQEGEQFWHLQYEGKSVRMPDRKGMKAIHYLLQQASRNKPDVSAQDLEQYETPSSTGATMSKGQRVEEDLKSMTGDHYDSEQRREDQMRLREIEEELERIEEEIEDVKADMRVQRATERPDKLEQLKDKKNRLRAVQRELHKEGEPQPVKKRRQKMRRRIRRSINAIREVHPALADHLDDAIATGKTCSYKPRESVDWSL